jgi:chromosome segregation ATPase
MSNGFKIISWKFFFLIIILIILAVIFLQSPNPCREPITYRIGKVDERFDLTRQEFAVAVNMAAAMWGKPFARDLFRENPQGEIEINLVYDYRQEATDKLKKLNYKIDNTKTSYEDLKSRLESLKAEHVQRSAILADEFSTYNSRINTFNTDIEYWNRRGGAPENIHKKMTQEKNELISLRENLQGRQNELKALTDNINSLVVVVNEIATNINLDLVNYQDTGNSLGHEFCEGLYQSKNDRQTINIYQFDNNYRLVRVLAHEFGHALRLNHSTNPKSVMYRLIQSDEIELSSDDIAALKNRCNN